MFCPQCGQQQVTTEVRFCSRCGFQLEGVTVLLANRGALPALAAQPDVKTPSPRRKGARQGGKLILFGIFLMMLFAMLHELLGIPDKLPLIGAMVFTGGLLRLLYALFFEEGAPRRQKSDAPLYVPPAPYAVSPSARESAATLPPGESIPARGYVPPRANTSEIGYQPSVTESTTRLLKDDRDEQGQR